MNYRQIETSREIRLWVTSIIGPVILGTATILASNPELLEKTRKIVTQKINNLKCGKREETL
jgi:hypothetical protein